MLYIGIYGARYESDRGHVKVTKPDGKVFWIPNQDIENITEVERLEELQRDTAMKLEALKTNKEKKYDPSNDWQRA